MVRSVVTREGGRKRFGRLLRISRASEAASWFTPGCRMLWRCFSGGAVGFSLGLIGGGGSVLAVPLPLYVVGISDAHVAIGTSALTVSANAFANLIGHWHAGNVKWPSAATFAAAGIIGVVIGSSVGKISDGQQLLFLFAFAMIAVGITMLRPRAVVVDSDIRMTPTSRANFP
jgi:uncharacterized membrane protein YfcA